MLDKYIYHVLKDDHLVGLVHLRNNLFVVLMETKYLNRIAITPPLHLSGKYTNGISVIPIGVEFSKFVEKYYSLNNELAKLQSFHKKIV